MSVLREIFKNKQAEVAAQQLILPEAGLAALALASPEPLNFITALADSSGMRPRLIAEIKRRSPSRGLLREKLDGPKLAASYAANGAAAISILTDQTYFGGSLDELKDVSARGVGLPILRKDFLFDRYQLLEARYAGASAVLLITAMLEHGRLRTLINETRTLGLAALVEIHSEAELVSAIEAGADVIGINNRDLHSFKVDLETTLRLAPKIPPGILIVAESGIRTPHDVDRLAEAGVHAMLVGEQLVTASDPGNEIRKLINEPKAATP
jgi:indole-3-glycerol phosphate synthase